MKKIEIIKNRTWNFAHHHQQQTNEDLLQGSQHDVLVLWRFSQWITVVTVSLLFSGFRKSIFILTLYVFICCLQTTATKISHFFTVIFPLYLFLLYSYFQSFKMMKYPNEVWNYITLSKILLFILGHCF